MDSEWTKLNQEEEITPMTTVNVYLTFNGNCKEAFDFYRSVFGGEFQYVGKYGQMPQQKVIQSVPDNEKDKIMHITLPISKETMLMGNDNLQAFGPSIAGNNFTISIKTDTKDEADKLFGKLSKGGEITMPMKETFWGSYYGMITDRFGIKWKMNVDLDERDK
jgi:PhnB protein